LTITTGIFYLLNAYLPLHIEPGEPGYDTNETYSYLYPLTVIDEAGQTVDNAEVTVKAVVNGSSYKLVMTGYTDGNGRISCWMMPGKMYIIFLNKSGYQNRTDNFIPQPPDLYGQVTGGVFKMYFVVWNPPPPLSEPDHISFTGARVGTTLFVNFTDDLNNTINSTIYIYEINWSTGIETLLLTVHNVSENNISVVLLGVNSTSSHKAIIYYNHSDFGSVSHTIFIMGDVPWQSLPSSDRPGAKLVNFLTVLVGYNPIGWGNFLLFMFLVAGFYYMDEKFAGIIMMFLGGIFLMLNLVFGFDSTLFTVAGGAIPALFLLVGIMYQWIQHKKRVSG
jgi:hypothetical protein